MQVQGQYCDEDTQEAKKERFHGEHKAATPQGWELSERCHMFWPFQTLHETFRKYPSTTLLRERDQTSRWL